MHVLNLASEHVCVCIQSQIFTITYIKPHLFININKWIISTPFPHNVIKIPAGQEGLVRLQVTAWLLNNAPFINLQMSEDTFICPVGTRTQCPGSQTCGPIQHL